MTSPPPTDDFAAPPERARDWLLRLAAELRRRGQNDAATRMSLIDWGRRYLPRHFKLAPSQMHLWLDEHLRHAHERRGEKLNIIGPRGAAKSTLVTLAYALRVAVEGWEPFIWIVSDTHRQACGHLENLKRELVDNPLLRADYPLVAGRGPVWRTSAAELASGLRIEAYGAGQRVRGRRHGADRPTLIICDDIQNDSHMESARQRELSLRWFEGTLLKAGTKRTNIINLATALHRDALAPRLHRTAGWKSHMFSAIARWPENMELWRAWESLYADADDPQREETAREFYEAHMEQLHAGAELLWPEEEDLYTLMRMRAEGGRAAFEREKQGSPVNPESCEWPEEYFEEPLWFSDWPSAARARVIALDPSKGAERSQGDFSAYVLLLVGEDSLLYVDANMARRPTPQIVADGAELCRVFQPEAFGVETNQFQQLLADEFSAEFARQGLLGVQPWTLENHVNKRVRIRRLGPLLARRRIRFLRGSPGAWLLVEQLRDFPHGDHDDGPDALEMAIRLAGELLGSGPDDGLGDRLPLSS